MLLPLVLSLPALAAALPSQLQSRQDNVHHIPLARRTIHRRGGFVDLDRIAKSAETIKYKYGLMSSEGIGRRASEATIEVINQVSLTVGVATSDVMLIVIQRAATQVIWPVSTLVHRKHQYLHSRSV